MGKPAATDRPCLPSLSHSFTLDFVLGYAGTLAEAKEIKEKIAEFLRTTLRLTLSAEKTLITHATSERARFLGYEIGIMSSQTKFDRLRRRTVNGKIAFYIPKDVLRKKRERYLRDGKIVHRTELTNDSEYESILRYQLEYRGLVEYYGLAQNIASLSYLGYTMETSLLKTLANKNRTTLAKTRNRLKAVTRTPHGPRKCLQLTIQRAGKRPLTATFGGLALRRKTARVKDQVLLPFINRRADVVERLLHDTCEVCESKGHIEMHHIRKLANLNKQGRREKPLWMKVMIAHKRKSLALCKSCHGDIHHNRPKVRK